MTDTTVSCVAAGSAAVEGNLIASRLDARFALVVSRLEARLDTARRVRSREAQAEKQLNKEYGVTAFDAAREKLESDREKLWELEEQFESAQDEALEAFQAKQRADRKLFDKKQEATEAAIDEQEDALCREHYAAILGVAPKKRGDNGEYDAAEEFSLLLEERISALRDAEPEAKQIEKLQDMALSAIAEASTLHCAEDLKAVWNKWTERLANVGSTAPAPKFAKKLPAKKAKAGKAKATSKPTKKSKSKKAAKKNKKK